MRVRVRQAAETDRSAIRDIYLDAFPATENREVAALAVQLLSAPAEQFAVRPTLNFIADMNNEVAGHVAFSPVWLETERDWWGYLLAPLGVQTRFQRSGAGSALIAHGIGELTERGVHVVFVYGDPKYYSRFEFSNAAAEKFLPPYTLQFPFGWQARMLHDYPLASAERALTCVPALCDPALW